VQQAWSTQDLKARDQFGYWREVVCDAFVTLDPQRRDDPAGGGQMFYGEVDARQHGDIGVAEIRSQAQRVARSAREIGKSPTPCYFLNMQVSGAGYAAQANREAILAPGDFVIVDATRPFELAFNGRFQQLSLKFPTQMAAVALHGAEDILPGLFVNGQKGVGAVLSQYAATLATELADCDTTTGSYMMSRFIELLSQVPQADGALDLGHRQQKHRALLGAIKTSLKVRLGDPDITPAAVAQKFGISLRSLHAMFAEDGSSFGRWLLAERLEGARRTLSAPNQQSRSIADIAYAWGFADQSHFGRTFRQRFDQSPREYQRGCRVTCE